MKGKFIIYMCLSFFAITSFSCKKKWQRTARVNLQVILAPAASNDRVSFNSGAIYLSRVSFSGKRKQANDVSFTDYPNKPINFSSGTGFPVLAYDIPQGTYSSISMEFELSKDTSGNSIALMGQYNSPNPNVGTVPLSFQINIANILKSSAVNSSGGSEISLSESKNSSLQVILNPSFWFSAIPQNSLDNAPQSVVAGQSTIVITPNANQSIYNTVLNKIDQGTKVVFN